MKKWNTGLLGPVYSVNIATEETKSQVKPDKYHQGLTYKLWQTDLKYVCIYFSIKKMNMSIKYRVANLVGVAYYVFFVATV